MGNRFSIDGLGVFGIVTGVLSLGYAAWQSYKLNKIANKMDMTLEEVEKKSKIDIEQELVDSVVERAVRHKVDKATVDTITAVKADMHQTISSQVQKEVNNQYKTLSDEVAEQISKNVAAISEEALSAKVLPRVEEKLLKIGDQRIGSVIKTCNDKLGSFVGVYENIEGLLNRKFNGGKSNSGRSITLNYDD